MSEDTKREQRRESPPARTWSLDEMCGCGHRAVHHLEGESRCLEVACMCQGFWLERRPEPPPKICEHKVPEMGLCYICAARALETQDGSAEPKRFTCAQMDAALKFYGEDVRAKTIEEGAKWLESRMGDVYEQRARARLFREYMQRLARAPAETPAERAINNGEAFDEGDG